MTDWSNYHGDGTTVPLRHRLQAIQDFLARIAELEAELKHEQESNHISIEQWGIWEERAKQAERDLAKMTIGAQMAISAHNDIEKLLKQAEAEMADTKKISDKWRDLFTDAEAKRDALRDRLQETADGWRAQSGHRGGMEFAADDIEEILREGGEG